MPTVIGYAYEADTHCVPCTKRRFPEPGQDPDEHSIPMYAEDSERNPITPIFSTQEVLHDIHCRQCRAVIAEAYQPDGTDQDDPPEQQPAAA